MRLLKNVVDANIGILQTNAYIMDFLVKMKKKISFWFRICKSNSDESYIEHEFSMPISMFQSFKIIAYGTGNLLCKVMPAVGRCFR